jgi:hypothetical protein
MTSSTTNRLEVPVSIGLTVVGIGMTTWAALSHAAPLVAPGATLIFFGSAWLGNALARHDVRLLPSPRAAEGPAGGESD